MHEPPPDSVYITPRRNTPLWAIFLWVIGGCVLIIAVLSMLGGFLMFQVASRSTVHRISCSSNLKQLATGMQMYVQDWDDRFPPKAQWQAGVFPYIKNTGVLVCPIRPSFNPGYAFNAALDRRPMKQIGTPGATPMLFESNLGVPEANDKLQSFVMPHSSMGYVAYVDGHLLPVPAAPSATAGLKSGAAK